MNLMDSHKEDLRNLVDKVFKHMSLILRPDKVDFMMGDKEPNYELKFRFEGTYKETDILQKQFVSIIMAYANDVLGYYSGSVHPFYVVLDDFPNDFKNYVDIMRQKGYNVRFEQLSPDVTAEIIITKIVNIDPLKFAGF